MLLEYIYILLHIFISLGLSLILFLLSYVLVQRQPSEEKISPYECGFNPFEDARKQFDVQFYLISILFIIFDLEISFLFPFVVVCGHIGLLGFFMLNCFLGILTLGFIYEGFMGALEG